MQRICRYPLLLRVSSVKVSFLILIPYQELVKSTPSDHTTYSELHEALECMEQVITEINEAQKQIERELNLMRAQQELRLYGMVFFSFFLFFFVGYYYFIIVIFLRVNRNLIYCRLHAR